MPLSSDKTKAYMKQYGQEHRNELRAYQQKNRVAIRANGKRWRDRVRAEVMASYGGQCVCCGESNLAFLTIDHVRNNGKEHRKMNLRGVNFYRFLQKQGCPKDDYQILCWNCNSAKANYGECPHVQEVRSLRIA